MMIIRRTSYKRSKLAGHYFSAFHYGCLNQRLRIVWGEWGNTRTTATHTLDFVFLFHLLFTLILKELYTGNENKEDHETGLLAF